MATQLNVWLAERTILHFEGAGVPVLRFWTDLQGSFANPLAIYRPHGDGVTDILDVDVTDYIRTYRDVATLYLSETAGPDDYIEYNVTIKGLINPDNVLIPRHDLSEAGAVIIPPSYMIEGIDGTPLAASCYVLIVSDWLFDGNVSTNLSSRQLSNITGSFSMQSAGGSKTYTLAPMSCDKRYAAVRWIAFDGSSRVHTFEVTKNTIAAQGAYSILTLDNSYNTIKGREDGMTIRLDGLDAYDFWYYSDLVSSSKVELSLDGVAYTQVDVTTKNATMPDGNAANGKLEIQVKWERYDAVAM